jgi:hypothetical protein
LRHESDQVYQIVYLHDYDLLSLKRSLLLFGFVRMINGAALEQSVSISERCLF